MKVITAKQLKKTYPTKPPVEALKDVSIDIYEGETVALLGPNGAGKTTFLRIITGILLPFSGEVTIFNCNPIKFPARAARFFRFLPETPFLLRDNSLWENARFWFEYWMENFPRDNLYEIFTRFILLIALKNRFRVIPEECYKKQPFRLCSRPRHPLLSLMNQHSGLMSYRLKKWSI